VEAGMEDAGVVRALVRAGPGLFFEDGDADAWIAPREGVRGAETNQPTTYYHDALGHSWKIWEKVMGWSMTLHRPSPSAARKP
jgi:hypothetical protein